MKIRIEKTNILDYVLALLSLIQFGLLVCNAFLLNEGLNLAIFYNNYIIILLIMLTLFIKDFSAHFLAITYYICFFIFLMGQKIYKEDKNVFLTFVRTELNERQFLIFLSIMSLGIIVSYYAYILSSNKSAYQQAKINVHYARDTRPILPLVRLLFFVTLPAALYMQLKIVLVRSAMEYTSGYLINVSVPTLIKIGYYLFSGFSLIYLALKPSKKETFFILGTLLLIEGGMQLIQGRRALFATTVFFIVWYLLKFYGIKKIHFKYLLLLALGGLGLVILFFFVEMNRGGISVDGVKFGYIIKKFMTSTGGSDSVIANTIVNKSKFPKIGVVYLIDPIINNPIVVLLTGKGGINQGPEYLKAFNSFSHWISYLTNSQLYNSGHGMGSSYLAEVYMAFGLIGVFVVSVIVGKLINYFARIRFDGSIFKTAIVFVIVKSLYTLPRDGLFSWFGSFAYLLVGFCIIYPFYNIYCRQWIEETCPNERKV